MGQTMRKALNCGALELLAGDPDWELGPSGPRRSAAFQERSHQSNLQEMRDEISSREAACEKLERKVADYNKEALANFGHSRRPNTLAADRTSALERAGRALQLMRETQTTVNNEKIIVHRLQSIMMRVETAERSRDNNRLFGLVEKVQRGATLSDRQMARMTEAQDAVVENDEEMMHAAAEFTQTMQAWDSTMAAQSNQVDLGDEKQLIAALSQLQRESETVDWTDTATTYQTEAASTTMLSRAPAAPTGTFMRSTSTAPARQAANTSGGVETVGGNRKPRFSKEDADLEDIF